MQNTTTVAPQLCAGHCARSLCTLDFVVVQGYCTPVVINTGREKCRGLQEPAEGACLEEETPFQELDQEAVVMIWTEARRMTILAADWERGQILGT